MVSKPTHKSQPMAVISDYPKRRQRLLNILPSSVSYRHVPELEEIKAWQPGKLVIMDYHTSAADKVATEVPLIKRCHPGILVLVIVRSDDRAAEAAAINAHADDIIKRPYSDQYLHFVVKRLSIYGQLYCASTSQLFQYGPAGAGQPTLGLLDAHGRLRPLCDLHRDIYAFAWHHHGPNHSAIARSLKIGRATWYRVIQKFKLRAE
jgi:DNA-binding NtrC family response regulator